MEAQKERLLNTVKAFQLMKVDDRQVIFITGEELKFLLNNLKNETDFQYLKKSSSVGGDSQTLNIHDY